MPELPEVETIARQLRAALVGSTIAEVEVFWERTVARPDVRTFRSALVGATVLDVGRRGKFLALQLSTGRTLLSHLRMSGEWLILPSGADPQAVSHVRVRLRLADGRWLLFSDTRKFGRMALVDAPEEVLGLLGPEPLSPDFTPARLARMLARRRARIKPLLLDQRFVAGLGNIYTDEALWRARIHPLRMANTLTCEEVERLHASIVAVLREAIEGQGTSLGDRRYLQVNGRVGAYQEELNAYGRAGQPCPRCSTPMVRLVVGQRGTCFCPVCQPFPV